MFWFSNKSYFPLVCVVIQFHPLKTHHEHESESNTYKKWLSQEYQLILSLRTKVITCIITGFNTVGRLLLIAFYKYKGGNEKNGSKNGCGEEGSQPHGYPTPSTPSEES